MASGQQPTLDGPALELVLQCTGALDTWDKCRLRLTCRAARGTVERSTQRLLLQLTQGGAAPALSAAQQRALPLRFPSVQHLVVHGGLGADATAAHQVTIADFLTRAFEAPWPGVLKLELAAVESASAALAALACTNARTLLLTARPPHQPTHPPAVAYACVRRLPALQSLTDGDSDHNLGNPYAAKQHSGYAVDTATLQALGHCSQLTELRCTLQGSQAVVCEQLQALWRLTGLRSLVLKMDWNTLREGALAGLSQLSQLRKLAIPQEPGYYLGGRRDDTAGLSSLSQCSCLEELCISALPTAQLQLDHLTSLTCQHLTPATLAALSGCQQLRQVVAYTVHLRVNPQAGAALRAVTALTFSELHVSSDDVQLACVFPALRSFICLSPGRVQVNSIGRFFGGMSALMQLHLAPQTWTPIEHHCWLNLASFAAIAHLHTLTELRFTCYSEDELTGIHQLSQLTCLRYLDIQYDEASSEHGQCLHECMQQLALAFRALPNPLDQLRLDVSGVATDMDVSRMHATFAHLAQVHMHKLQLIFSFDIKPLAVTASGLHILVAGCAALQELEVRGYNYWENDDGDVCQCAELDQCCGDLRNMYAYRGLRVNAVFCRSSRDYEYTST